MKRLLLIALMVIGLKAEATVSLLTALPGTDIYQLEGHSGLRIVDSAGRDITVNWGVFDFNSPNFVYRFVSGQTDYECWAYPTEFFIQSYRLEGRQVIEQVLNLDSIQEARIIELVANNLRPENQIYRYNYVKDNCATRPMAMIEAAAGRKLLSDDPAQTTFRKEMQRYHQLYPWYQFGIDLALGRGIDRPISRRQATFAPVELMQQLSELDIVTETHTYGRQTSQPRPTPWPLTPMAVSVYVLLWAIAATFMRGGRVFDTVYFAIAFIGGMVLTFLVFISTHEATSPNLLLLWLNPLCIAGSILPWLKKAKNLCRAYFCLNLLALIALVICAPILGRGMNAAFWPLIGADILRSATYLRKR